MSHKLTRLSKSILETPQLITPTKFKEIADVLENRELLNQLHEKEMLFDVEDESQNDNDKHSEKNNYGVKDLGILRVEGPTTYRPTMYEMLCGTGASYVGLLDQMKEFAEQGKKKVLMKVDSPGGQAYRMIFTSKELRRIADENGIELVAYCDGTCASAGMGLASSAHTIVANPEAELGSIGVVVSLMDTSKAMDEEGYKRIFITAGKDKVPFAEDGSFKPEFLNDIQTKVDKLYSKFTTHVATMRNLSVEDVVNTNANMFDADDALSLGLADKVMEEPEFLKWFLGSDYSDEEQTPSTQQSKSLQQKETLMSAETPVVETPQLSVEEIANLQALVASYQAKEVADTKASLTSTLESKPFLVNCKEDIISLLMNTEIGEDVKTLMNSVISDADAHIETLTTTHTEKLATVKTEAQTKVDEAISASNTAIAEAQTKVDKMKTESDKVKEEFATTKHSIDGEILESVVEGDKKTDLADFIKNKHNL